MKIIFALLVFATSQAFATAEPGGDTRSGDIRASKDRQEFQEAEAPHVTSDSLLKVIEDVVNPEHQEMHDLWQKYLRGQGLDPENEDRTLFRLKQKYLQSIDDWGAHLEDCESSRSSTRWMRRLKRKFGAEEIEKHKKDIAKIITSLYLQRKSECISAQEEKALRAERELEAFSVERMRLLIDFVSQTSDVHLSQLNKKRLLAAYSRKQQHPISTRTVDLNALRLETKLRNLPPDYVEFLSHEQSLKKPFDLTKNLSQLDLLITPDPTPVHKHRRKRKKQEDISIKTTG